MSGLGEKLGLPSGKYEPFSTVIQAENTGVIVANQTASQQCVRDIGALTCGSPEMMGAYDPSLTNPYLNIGAAIPSSLGSCPDIF